ncbi:acyl dehydratase [Nocardioides albertanoniae]|uniref:Acyl dehydratase n=1 Tax=Nocardioides albertanoniae TaxID=1175486 RepID=A0A543A751_9ACTN|nr:MaoC/PaaZ C-terminal domain-containing protein [Nocardioides albertanoniae]TQL68424.1 acyl dehydratase [Nocardioides albertanoniae]
MASAQIQRSFSGKAGPGLLLKAALPAIPGVNTIPGIKKTGAAYDELSITREPVVLERDAVAAYAELCGFPIKDTVPLPYPHMLAFPLHMALMSSPEFPSPAMGMVHIENSISGYRPISVGEAVAVTTTVGQPEPHPVGKAYRFLTVATVGGEVVWESTSTYLVRGRRNPDVVWPSDFAEVNPSGPVFPLKTDLGRRYAKVAGDYNPIHLFPLSAKALGFKRQIAHGMWTKARCIAALENRLPDAARVDVAFKKPVFLPSSVAFGSLKHLDGYDFSLHKRGSDTLHLVGRTTAL